MKTAYLYVRVSTDEQKRKGYSCALKIIESDKELDLYLNSFWIKRKSWGASD